MAYTSFMVRQYSFCILHLNYEKFINIFHIFVAIFNNDTKESFSSLGLMSSEMLIG